MLLLGLLRLDAPPPWWDEGWTLSVARNWVEHSHYGRLLDGQLAPGGLQANDPTTISVGLMFRLLGVGLWQGRVSGVLYATLALVCLYLLARQLYDRTIGIGALAVTLLLSMHPQLNPLIQGRQVLGEMPMLASLVGGYVCFMLALRRSPIFIVPAMILWANAIISKAQTLPFWAVSLGAAILVALLLRQWRAALLAGGGLVGTYLLVPYLILLWTGMYAGQSIPADQITGLYEVLAFVLQWSNRMFALSMVLMFGIPTLLGLGYAVWQVARELRRPIDPEQLIMRVALLGFSGSWLAWFLLLSVGVPRYMFPAIFVASIFVAVFFRDLTGGFDLAATLGGLIEPLRRRFTRRAGASWLAVLLLAMALPLTMLTYYRYYLVFDDRAAQRVAAYLNSQPPGTRIETYESELHFFLNQPYHYPPDQVHVELNQRSLLGRSVPIAYDPLVSDPQYLVVGMFTRGNRLYEPVVQNGAFRLVLRDGDYQVYQRVR